MAAMGEGCNRVLRILEASKHLWISCGSVAVVRIMPSKQKIDRTKVNAALNTQCPKCGYSIPPSQIARVDFEHVECPRCGDRFIPRGRST